MTFRSILFPLALTLASAAWAMPGSALPDTLRADTTPVLLPEGTTPTRTRTDRAASSTADQPTVTKQSRTEPGEVSTSDRAEPFGHWVSAQAHSGTRGVELARAIRAEKARRRR